MQKGIGASFYFIGLVALFVYTNTLIGDFTFDDNFAVITNGDVTSDSNPLAGLFRHDFWGQDIASTQSHKSYRPITILAFRWTRQAWDWVQLLVPGINTMLPTAPGLPMQQQQKDTEQQDTFSNKSPRPPGLHPFPFHLLSVVLHAVVSMMVLALAQHLFTKLELTTGSIAAVTGSSSTSSSGSSSSSGLASGWLMLDAQPGLWLTPLCRAGQQQALITALLFALHPVHTEAVAGVVGCAELICAAWSLPALLLYFMAVDGRYAAAQRLQQHVTNCNSAPPSRTPSGSCVGRASTGSAARSRQLRGRNAFAAGAAADSGAAASTSELDHAALRLYCQDALQHWLLVLAAASLALLAALSKEIGITITGTMALYDLLLAPHMLPQGGTSGSGNSSRSSSSSHAQQQQQQLRQQQRAHACRLQLLRILVLVAVTVGYVRLRSWVAVQQLVSIYRKVENPIPFAQSVTTRILTTGYLHARYFGLLLFPVYLSADWSFSCIPLVEQLSDPRNVATVALYAYFVYVGLSAGPVAYLKQLWGAAKSTLPGQGPASAAPPMTARSGSSSSGKRSNSLYGGTSQVAAVPADAQQEAAEAAVVAGARPPAVLGGARWRLLVVVGLLIAPYFPASNVLFYVGTFIGERLLYFPSVGYCLLLADLFGKLLPAEAGQQQQLVSSQPGGQPADTAQQSQEGGQGQLDPDRAQAAATAAAADGSDAIKQAGPGQASSITSKGSHRRSLGSVLVALAVVVVCCGYAGRTLLRNADWWDEERLFVAAEQVCPNSAKVQQNCGVLQRRYHNFTAAMKHFQRAQEIEPGYCEPSYWIALTTINNGDVLRGLAAMKASLACKYTSSEALQTLNKLYVMMHDNTPGDPMPMVEWAGVLTSKNVLRVADGCATAEDAAMLAAVAGKSENYISQTLDICLQGLKGWDQTAVEPDTLASLARVKYSSLNTTLLRQCVKLRRSVYNKLSGNSPKSVTVRKAMYKYISKVQAQHPGCRGLGGGGSAPMDDEDAGLHTPSSHQKLLHRVQSADPEDPWLQLEWGQTLIALGGEAALKDASVHMEVATAIFSRIQQELHDSTAAVGGADSSGNGQPAKQKKHGKQQGSTAAAKRLSSTYTALDGKTPFTPETALEAATLPLERFKQAASTSSAPASKALFCEMFKRLCHLRLQMVVLVQQTSTAGGTGDSGAAPGSVTAGLRRVSNMKAVLNAKAAGRRCLIELSEKRGCEEQADEIRRLVGRGTD